MYILKRNYRVYKCIDYVYIRTELFRIKNMEIVRFSDVKSGYI